MKKIITKYKNDKISFHFIHHYIYNEGYKWSDEWVNGKINDNAKMLWVNGTTDSIYKGKYAFLFIIKQLNNFIIVMFLVS